MEEYSSEDYPVITCVHLSSLVYRRIKNKIGSYLFDFYSDQTKESRLFEISKQKKNRFYKKFIGE